MGWGHMGITLAQGHTGVTVVQAHGGITLAQGHHGVTGTHGWPGYRNKMHHILVIAPTREEGLREVKMCHNSCVGVREQPRDPGEGLLTPVSVPAAVTPPDSSCSGRGPLVSSRAEDLQGDAHPPPGCPQRGDEGCSCGISTHRCTGGTSTTHATQTTPGWRPWPSVCTSTPRTTWR